MTQMNYLKWIAVSLILHAAMISGYNSFQEDVKSERLRPLTMDIFTFKVAGAEPEGGAGNTDKPAEKPYKPDKKNAAAITKNAEKVKPEPDFKDVPIVKPPEKEKIEAAAEESEYISDSGTEEYVPLKTEDTALPAYDEKGFIGNESENSAEESAPAGDGDSAGDSVSEAGDAQAAADYMRINLRGIRKKIQRRLEYPSVAKRMGIRGETEVKFRVFPDGKVENVSIFKSSGNNMLDEAALEAVIESAPLPEPSAVVSIVLSVNFSLN